MCADTKKQIGKNRVRKKSKAIWAIPIWRQHISKRGSRNVSNGSKLVLFQRTDKLHLISWNCLGTGVCVTAARISKYKFSSLPAVTRHEVKKTSKTYNMNRAEEEGIELVKRQKKGDFTR